MQEETNKNDIDTWEPDYTDASIATIKRVSFLSKKVVFII